MKKLLLIFAGIGFLSGCQASDEVPRGFEEVSMFNNAMTRGYEIRHLKTGCHYFIGGDGVTPMYEVGGKPYCTNE